MKPQVLIRSPYGSIIDRPKIRKPQNEIPAEAAGHDQGYLTNFAANLTNLPTNKHCFKK